MTSLKGSPTKCEQVKGIIRNSIRAGELNPGERILPVSKLAATLKTSQVIAHRALSQLVEEKWLECHGIRGFFVRKDIKVEEVPSAVSDSTSPRKNSECKLFLFCQHHSDLFWKWPSATYARIREKQLTAMAEALQSHSEFHAAAEQAEVLRIYFKKHPELLPIFQKAHKEGRFTLTGGEVIPDTNMVSGETLVRILQSGKAYYREVFGEDTMIACLSDAFGMSAQLPQILSKCGYRYLYPGRMPGLPEKLQNQSAFLWQGLDGTAIVLGQSKNIHPGTMLCNLPVIYAQEETLYEKLSSFRTARLSENLLLHYKTEIEDIRYDLLFPLLKRINSEPGETYLGFGSIKDFFSKIKADTLPIFSGEFNPVFTGCYTTRIDLKQRIRATENILFAAELLAAIINADINFENIWHKFMLTTFHDVICGCHHDPVSEEIQCYLNAINHDVGKIFSRCAASLSKITVLNPSHISGQRIGECPLDEMPHQINGVAMQYDRSSVFFQADLPAFGIRSFCPAEQKKKTVTENRQAPSRFKTHFFDVDFSSPHPVIQTSCGIFTGSHFGEILFRQDCGSMWDERYAGVCYGHENEQEKIVSIEEGSIFYRVEIAGEVLPNRQPAWDGTENGYWAGFQSLKYSKIFRFYKELNYFTLHIRLNWTGKNTKIFVRFPLALNVHESRALYHIPFGAVTRKPYFEVKRRYQDTLVELSHDDYLHASGDWPALHWVDYSDLSSGCAIANSGTPGFQCVNGDVVASLLRSGTMIQDGVMTPQQGALDNGTHEYDFAIAPHGADGTAAIHTAADALNRKPILIHGTQPSSRQNRSFVSFDQEDIVISSARRTKAGTVIHVHEISGRFVRTSLSTCQEKPVFYISDLQEQEWKKHDNHVFEFTPYEIKTILIKSETIAS